MSQFTDAALSRPHREVFYAYFSAEQIRKFTEKWWAEGLAQGDAWPLTKPGYYFVDLRDGGEIFEVSEQWVRKNNQAVYIARADRRCADWSRQVESLEQGAIAGPIILGVVVTVVWMVIAYLLWGVLWASSASGEFSDVGLAWVAGSIAIWVTVWLAIYQEINPVQASKASIAIMATSAAIHVHHRAAENARFGHRSGSDLQARAAQYSAQRRQGWPGAR